MGINWSLYLYPAVAIALNATAPFSLSNILIVPITILARVSAFGMMVRDDHFSTDVVHQLLKAKEVYA
jgi:hypothetical protein